MIRVAAFLLLVAAVACSSTREISLRASAIQEHATSIIRTTDQMDTTSPQVQQIRTDAEAISASVGVIHREVTAVADVVPWWATLIRYALLAAIGAAVVYLFSVTGLASACRVALGWIPRRAVSEAEMAAATMATDKPETIREWIAMKRASDKEFDAAWRKTQQEQKP